MMVRNGFVSNSSSSSFILLIDKSKSCPECGINLGSLFYDIIKQPNYSDSCDATEVKAEGYKAILARCNSDYDTEHHEKIKKLLELYNGIPAKENKVLVELSVSYHDPMTKALLQLGIDNGVILDIYKES